MQLFSLVNNLLYEDVDCFKRRLHIQRFSVTPLAPQAGLLGWVNDSDTLHVLVKEYRDSRKVLIDIERRLGVRFQRGSSRLPAVCPACRPYWRIAAFSRLIVVAEFG